MRFGSCCSGIEAASVAWHPLGWRAAWLSEIEPFPSAVLKHHYPDVPNLGDMTNLPERILSGEVEAPDVFCGGTPCQAFSVAGLRKSLDDARGNLSLTFCEIANAIDTVRRERGDQPAIIFWENVPGVLSTKDNAFGCFLAGLAGEDDPIIPPGDKWTDTGCVFGPERAVAWRVLDAQYFGLAQRRRRVFVVASARDNFDPAAVLFEFDGVRRDTAPSRETGERVAPCVTNGPPFSRTGNERVEVKAMVAVEQPYLPNIAGSLDTQCGGGKLTHQSVANGHVIGTITARMFNALGARDVEEGALLPVAFHNRQDPDVSGDITHPLGAKDNGMGVMQPVTYDFFNITAPVNRQSREPGDPCHTLARSNAEHAVVMQPVAIGTDCYNGAITGDVAATIGTPGSSVNASGPTVMQPVAIGLDEEQNARIDGFGTLKARMEGGGFEGTIMTPAMQVRRLTPVECERLQGFPDGYTAIPWRKKPASECPDGPRYKALGNSWAVPVVRWIGARINAHISVKEAA